MVYIAGSEPSRFTIRYQTRLQSRINRFRISLAITVEIDMGTTFLDLAKAVKINFAQGVLEQDSGSTLDYQFEISPKDFLSYSKQDFRTNDKRGNVYALTNAKRAIDCQTDKRFCSLGLDPNSFPPVIEEFISKSQNSPLKKDLPIRLKFLQAMAFAPAEIVANARLLRNKLEHYYKNPSDEEVSDAIELVELFIRVTIVNNSECYQKRLSC